MVHLGVPKHTKKIERLIETSKAAQLMSSKLSFLCEKIFRRRVKRLDNSCLRSESEACKQITFHKFGSYKNSAISRGQLYLYVLKKQP